MKKIARNKISILFRNMGVIYQNTQPTEQLPLKKEKQRGKQGSALFLYQSYRTSGLFKLYESITDKKTQKKHRCIATKAEKEGENNRRKKNRLHILFLYKDVCVQEKGLEAYLQTLD